MKLQDTLIAWNPNTDEIKVGPLLSPGDADWTRLYSRTGGAAYLDVRDLEGFEAGQRVLSDFIGITLRDGVCQNACHNAFLAIDEYRNAVPVDMEIKF